MSQSTHNLSRGTSMKSIPPQELDEFGNPVIDQRQFYAAVGKLSPRPSALDSDSCPSKIDAGAFILDLLRAAEPGSSLTLRRNKSHLDASISVSCTGFGQPTMHLSSKDSAAIVDYVAGLRAAPRLRDVLDAID